MHAACDFQVHVPSWQPGIKVPLDVLDIGLLAPTRRSLRGWSQSQRPGPSEGMTAAAIASAALADEAADSEAIAALVAAPAASSTSQHVRAREVTTVEIKRCAVLFTNQADQLMPADACESACANPRSLPGSLESRTLRMPWNSGSRLQPAWKLFWDMDCFHQRHCPSQNLELAQYWYPELDLTAQKALRHHYYVAIDPCHFHVPCLRCCQVPCLHQILVSLPEHLP